MSGDPSKEVGEKKIIEHDDHESLQSEQESEKDEPKTADEKEEEEKGSDEETETEVILKTAPPKPISKSLQNRLLWFQNKLAPRRELKTLVLKVEITDLKLGRSISRMIYLICRLAKGVILNSLSP